MHADGGKKNKTTGTTPGPGPVQVLVPGTTCTVITHQNFFRTLNRRENPQRRRIIDSNARVGYPSSAPRRFF